MCDDVVLRDSYSLQFVPDWFVTQRQIKIWDDDDYYYDDDEITEYCNGYHKRKAQKVDWCMPEDEKRLWTPVAAQGASNR